MEQKIKLSILAALLIVIIAGSAYFIERKKIKDQALQPADSAQTAQTNQIIADEISGKIRSINEKAVYIELEDGKGFAANINPITLVITQGVAKPGTLVDLKTGQNVAVKVDNASNVIQILIKK